MSLLFNMLSRVITFFPRSKCLLISWLQLPSAVVLEPKKIKSVTVSIVSPCICHELMAPDAMHSLYRVWHSKILVGQRGDQHTESQGVVYRVIGRLIQNFRLCSWVAGCLWLCQPFRICNLWVLFSLEGEVTIHCHTSYWFCNCRDFFCKENLVKTVSLSPQLPLKAGNLQKRNIKHSPLYGERLYLEKAS